MITFQPSADNTNLGFRHTTLCKSGEQVEVGLYPTLFGMRVRAGRVGDIACYLDWCCGAEDSAITLFYRLCLAILNARLPCPDSRTLFQDIPCFPQIKPAHLDQSFLNALAKLPQKPVKISKIPPFQTLKGRYKIQTNLRQFREPVRISG